jgi:hypothetical protein
MALINNIAGTVATFIRSLGATAVPTAGEGILGVHAEDLNGNPLALLHGAPLNTSQYGLPISGANDGNSLNIRVDRTGGLALATVQPLFSWFVEGATLNTRLFTTFLTTQTAAQTTQGVTLNSGAINTITTNAQLNTFQLLPLHMKAPALMRARMRVTQAGVANTNAEYGYATVSTTLGTTANLNGLYWRFDSAGIMPVFAFNGSVVSTGVDITSLITAAGGLANTYHWGILKDDDSFTFTCQNTSTGRVISRQTIVVPAGQQKAFLSSHLQPYARVWNAGVAPTNGAQLIISEWTMGLLDVNMNLSASQIMTGLGLGAETGPLTYTTTSNLTNAAVVPTQTLSNTATGQAALDGGVRFAAPAGAATNDFTLFSYTVPAGYRYRTKRVTLAAKNLGAAVATTPTQIDYFLVVNGNGVTLVGNLQRKYLGTQTFPIGAAIGQQAAEGQIIVDFSEGDLITEPGRVVGLMCRISTGTATASQVIETFYTNVGHFE